MSLFNRHNTNTPPVTPPTPAPAGTGGPVATNAHRLAVSKALRQIEFIAQSIGLQNCPMAPQHMADLEHDLILFHTYDDLKAITLELHSNDRSIIAEFKFEFLNGQATMGGKDIGNGIELPFITRGLVSGFRFLVSYNGQPRTFAHLLKMRWSDAPRLPRQEGRAFNSAHTGRITGGRQRGSFFVSDGLRRRLRVVEAGCGGFAFAQDIDSPGAPIYLHRDCAAPGLNFQVGQMLRATIVQTPRGLQGRNIEPMAQ